MGNTGTGTLDGCGTGTSLMHISYDGPDTLLEGEDRLRAGVGAEHRSLNQSAGFFSFKLGCVSRVGGKIPVRKKKK